MQLVLKLRRDFEKWLKEDVPYYDVTVTSIKDLIRDGVLFGIYSKEPVYLCELVGIVEEALRDFGIEAKFERGWSEGWIGEIRGDTSTILTMERTLLNFLIHVLSISTEVRKVRELLNRSGFENVRLATTRKTVPGMRTWAKLFASCAGADTHRLGLSDMLMIKDTHLAAVGDFEKALIEASKRKSFSHKLEVEVRNEEQALIASKYADVVMLDNFPPERAKEVACKLKAMSNVIIEVSGGVNKDNVLQYLNECIDVVSMGYLTINPPRVDLSMRVKE
ncbi:carboxylating nicotinate-nucleotide diphosphorylase [Ignicoccus islandicus]|uniref:carboxylating nicotinate-nucleotide diphosphorylase n=1 Tax=Ignicoccus islandicus TaxID=54259 RepID=UPI0009467917|nr:carboxylating nicotinate-nucleotide diphosphorylase [Ignicoccus islandicus]